ncbi:nucleoside diphosphate kinase 2, chloroplastic [Nymphaea colorata]|nr:nucleoside diphosphate kinase 2, chloroplastic [Nymphaea colorata]XP_031500366.1 nucleoside diphosphate kinase 2, chloroplastic [Nymphaea colorata]
MAMVTSVNWKGGSTLTSSALPTNRGCVVNSNGTPKRITSSLMVSFGSNIYGPAASINKACTLRLRQQLQQWSQPNLIPRYRRRPANNVFLPHLVASMEVEVTYIMVKPDGVQRGLVGEIISRFEKKGFLMKGLKLFQCSKELAEEHYKDLKSKPFFPKLIEYITSGPVVCMAWEGVGVVASARKLIGATNPLQAEPGTIRGDLAIQTGRNIVHGSDSPENGLREIALWFKEGELCEWAQVQAPWLME